MTMGSPRFYGAILPSHTQSSDLLPDQGIMAIQSCLKRCSSQRAALAGTFAYSPVLDN